MFVCDYCREHALENKGVAAVKSRGGCELCGYYDVCWDLKAFKCKENWKDLVYKESSR